MQKVVLDFIEKYHLQTNAQSRYIDLVSEVGELGKEILVCTNYGKDELIASNELANELGDCLFSLLALSCELNINAEEMLKNVLAKYEQRFCDKGNIGSK